MSFSILGRKIRDSKFMYGKVEVEFQNTFRLIKEGNIKLLCSGQYTMSSSDENVDILHQRKAIHVNALEVSLRQEQRRL